MNPRFLLREGYSLCRTAFVYWLLIAIVSLTSAYARDISSDEAERAAAHYAQRQWPGATCISVTPYYALDGSVNAWVCQFAKRGSPWKSEAALRVEGVAREMALAIALTGREAPRDTSSASPRFASAEPTGGVVHQVDGDRVRFVLPEQATSAEANIRQEARVEIAQDATAWKLAQDRVREARRNTLFADEICTVIIAGNDRLYPLLEMFDGVAPHLYEEPLVASVAGVSRTSVVVSRSYYLGPIAVMHEIKGKPDILIDARGRRQNKLNQKAIRSPGSGRLPGLTKYKRDILPADAWESVLASRDFLPTVERESDLRARVIIQGAPYYHQDDYAPNSCGPVACAQAVGYWDDHGYGNLIDNGSADTGHDAEAVFHLMRTMDYTPSDGTYGDEVASGIRDFLRHVYYGNTQPIGVRDINGDDGDLYWSDVTSEIDADRPFVYFNWDKDEDPKWAHYTTATGYDDADPAARLLFIHDNYHDTERILNWSNIPGDNERMYPIKPYGAPWECVYSEDFEEGIYGSSWQIRIFGGSGAGWGMSSHRTPRVLNDPRPPGGETCWSLYCAGSGINAPGPYPPNTDSFLVYGPFSTIGATEAWVQANVWFNSPDSGDYVAFAVSLDGVNYDGEIVGNTGGDWIMKSLDLATAIPGVLNKGKVWVAFHFHSDGDGSVGEGCYIDNIAVGQRGSFSSVGIPSGLNATDGEFAGKVRVSWLPVAGATHYKLQAQPAGGDWQEITGWIEATSFDHTKLFDGYDYYYKVRAAAGPDGWRAGSWSPLTQGWARPAPPGAIDADDGDSRAYIKVSWTSSPGYFQLSRSEQYEGAPYVPISNWTQSATFWDSSAVPGRIYWYAVRKSRWSDGSKPSLLGYPTSGWRALSPPTNVTASDGDYSQKISISWDPSPGASHYLVYRATHPEGQADPISGWITATSLDDTTADPVDTYYYRVQAAVDGSGARASGYSPYDTGWRALPPPGNVTATDGDYTDRVIISWDTVPGAAYYYVQGGLTADGFRYPLHWATQDTSFTYWTEPGHRYYFWVQASTTNGYYRPSPAGGPDTGFARIPPPENIQATDGTHPVGVQVSWDPSLYGHLYTVYRATQPDAMSWRIIATDITSISLVDTDATQCLHYYYFVDVSNGELKSEKSAPDEGWSSLPSPAMVQATDGLYEDGIRITWSEVEHATHYNVYRLGHPGPPTSIEASISGWITSRKYIDTTCDAGGQYYYWVAAALDHTGDCASAFGLGEPGYCAEYPVGYVQASDGTYSDRINVEWDPIFGDVIYYQVARSDTPTGVRDPVSSWQTDPRFVDANVSVGETYWYWVRYARSADGERPSLWALDSGYTGISKWIQNPNMTSGYDTISREEPGYRSEVFDNWSVSDSSPITAIRWWGSYPGWRPEQGTAVDPPTVRPTQFRLSWYAYTDGSPATVGNLVAEETVSLYTEEWYGAINQEPNGDPLFEHEYMYSAELTNAWNQTASQDYFLKVEAVFTDSATHPWGWLNSNRYTAPAAWRSYYGSWEQLTWKDGHPNAGNPMDVAFELLAAPESTPTPTPTPTPQPDPRNKWVQWPNMLDGYDSMSYYDPAYFTQKMYDDCVCTDGSEIYMITWWGSYFGWRSQDPSAVQPPLYPVTAFVLEWYESISTASGPRPGTLLARETVTDFIEAYHKPIPSFIMPNTWEHEYQYEAVLTTPWNQTAGQRYFLSIQAVHGNPAAMYSWGWLNASESQGEPALMEMAPRSFMEQQWPPGHRLATQPMDMAYILWSEAAPSPTPSPTPSPSPTISPTPTPSPTPSPTPTVTPSPTPDSAAWNQHPNMLDPQPGDSSGYTPARNTDFIIADDWQSNGAPIGSVTFYGAYSGWQMQSTGPVNAPEAIPSHFQLSRHAYDESGAGPEPGVLLNRENSTGYTQTYIGSVEWWDMPSQYIHIFRFECPLAMPWTPFQGEISFLTVQAIYTDAPPMYVWTWLDSTDQWNSAALQDFGTGFWLPMSWPPGHRREYQPMDMAFMLHEVPGPTPTPSVTPTETPLPPPSPTPVDLQGRQAPNLIDGYDQDSWSLVDGSTYICVADDFIFTGVEPIRGLRFWGSYPMWMAQSPNETVSPGWIDPTLPPNTPWPSARPLYFIVRIYESEAGTTPQPGELIVEESCRNYTEDWHGSMPLWNAPGSYEHEYEYVVAFGNSVSLQDGVSYFLSIQAFFADTQPDYWWGWLNSGDITGNPALRKEAGADWTALSWPSGHRLQGQPMNLAFEWWTDIPPTVTPTPSPSPTFTPTPVPTQPGWYILTINSSGGVVARNPDQAAYAPGSSVKLTAKPDPGKIFSGWSGAVPNPDTSSNPLELLMDGDKTISANYAVREYTLNVSAPGGNVHLDPEQTTYHYGDIVSITAQFAPPRTFLHWEGDVLDSDTQANPLEILMDSDKTITAVSEQGSPAQIWYIH